MRRGQRLRAEVRFGLALTLMLAGIAMWLRSGLATPPVTFLAGPLAVLVAFAATALYATIGLAITLQRPEVRTGRILAWVAIIQSFRDLSWGYLALAESSGTPMPLDPALAAWLNFALTIPLVGALLISLAVIFPTDRPQSSSGWSVATTALVGGSLVIVGTVLRPGLIVFAGTLENPLRLGGLGPIPAVLLLAGYAVLVATAALAAVLVVARYRLADGQTRAQLRVFVGSAAFLAMMFAALTVMSLADLGTRTARDLVAVGFFVGTALIPLAVAVAVARYRLYAIDRLVSRSFVYGLLVAILAGLAAASIQVFTALFRTLAGEVDDAVVVLTTLLVVSVITPIKARLETVARKITSDPSLSATSERGDVVSAPDAPPEFGDPAFLVALDARITAIVEREHPTVIASRSDRGSGTRDSWPHGS